MNRLLASSIVRILLLLAINVRGGAEDQNPFQQAGDIQTRDTQDVQAWIKNLTHETPSYREEAAKSLGLIGDRSAVEPLIRALDDDAESVAAAAATALGRIRDPQAVDPLVKALDHRSMFVCEAAADALSVIGGSRALEGLMGALRDKWQYARECAVRSLAKIGDDNAVEAIVKSLQDRYKSVRWEAAIALDHLKWNPRTEDEKIAYLIAREAWDELIAIGASALPAIFRMLEDDAVQKEAAKALDRLHWQPQTDTEKVTYLIAKDDEEELLRMDSRARDSLIDKLGSEHDSTRLYAARVLGQIVDPKAIPALVHALGDEWDWVNQAAADALDRLNWRPGTDAEKVAYFLAKQDWPKLISIGKPAVPSLINTLTGGNPVKEKGAATALGQIGDRQAVQPLIKALGTKGCQYRAEAAIALGDIGDSRAIQPLYDTLKGDNHDLQYAASIALSKIGPSARDLIIKALRDSDPSMRESAARALGTARDAKAAGELIAALKDSQANVRRVAAWALGTIGDKRAFDTLIGLLRDKDPGVRGQAASALQRIDRQCYNRWMAWQNAKMFGIPGAIIILLIAVVLVILRREFAKHR